MFWQRRKALAMVATGIVTVIGGAAPLGALPGISAGNTNTVAPTATATAPATNTATPRATSTATPTTTPTEAPAPTQAPPSATATIAIVNPPPTSTAQPSPTVMIVVPPAPPVVGRPSWGPDLLRRPLTRGDVTRAVVHLTFDDGWGYPDQILAVLQQKGARATACLNGRFIAGHPAFVQRWAAAGYSFCNHTYTHSDMTSAPLLWAEGGRLTMSQELTETERVLGQVVPGATMMPFFRPPYGSHDGTVVDVAASLGYRTVLWSLDPRDWSGEMSAAGLREYVVNSARPGDVILLHFTRASTLEALLGIIDGLLARGFSIEGLESLPSTQ